MNDFAISLIISAACYGAFCLMLLYRVAKGPHAVDRVVAAESVDSVTVVIMALFGAIANRAIYLDLALIVALLGFLSTVVTARYLEGDL